MVYINEQGYLERKTKAGKRNPTGKGTTRNWWLIKYCQNKNCGQLMLGNQLCISVPSKYVAKRIRLKVEVM